MLQLAGSLLAPVAGALLYGWLHDRPYGVRLVDGFMYVAVPALVLWQVVPHVWASHGLLAIGVFVLGLGTPALIERISHRLAPHADNLALLAGLSGLSLHAFLEGAALVSNGIQLGLAVILHRIPVGLTVWWLLRPRRGFGGASIGIAAILAATVAGYVAGARFFGDGHGGVGLYQAFVGGSL
ncbi:MAG: hypothetical protein OXT64_14005, partial [Gammaproteobacteria bacterium]|nr:hypothetical protein [Gammaproteobacteria bacterium]